MKVKYVGRHTAGVQIVANGVAIRVEHGGSVDVDEVLGSQLLSQGDEWEAVKAAAKAAASGSTNPADEAINQED
jgi:hypothetical protein